MAMGFLLTISALACNGQPDTPQASASDTENSEDDVGYSATIVQTTGDCESLVSIHGHSPYMPPETLRRLSDAIVRGTTVARETVYRQYRYNDGSTECHTGSEIVSLRVDEFYKGEGPDIVRFIQDSDLSIEDDSSYLLYMKEEEDNSWRAYYQYRLADPWQGVWKVEGDRAVRGRKSIKISELMTLGVRRYPVWK